MKKIIVTAVVLLISLYASVGWAAMSIKTGPVSTNYTGAVADNYIESQNPTYIRRTGNMTLRNNNSNRICIPLMRFDLSSVKAVTGQDLTGALFTHSVSWSTTGVTRTYDVWGLIDGAGDTWDSNALTYNLAIGGLGWVIPASGTGTYGIYSMNTTYWQLLGTVTFTVPSGTPTVPTTIVSNATNLNLTSFLNSDTNNLVTLAITPFGNSNNWENIVSADGTTNTTQWPTLTFPNAYPLGASNPAPAVNAQVTDLNLSQLSFAVSTDIGKYDVWFGPVDANSVNYKTLLTKIATVENGTLAQTVAIPDNMRPLTDNATYSWVVDCYKGNPLPSDPNIPGTVWKFLATGIPVVTGHPAEQIKFEATETATFTVTVSSFSTVTYTWYRSTDNVNNTPADDVQVGSGTELSTLTLNNLTRTNEGYYYCKAVNASGEANAARSNTARLVVKRKIAHWTMDAVDGGQYLDSSGEGRNATAAGTPVLVPGVNSNAATIDSSNGWATVGTFNPTAIASEFTLSMWVKWAGPNGSWQGLISKSDFWDATNNKWQLEIQAPVGSGASAVKFNRFGNGSVSMDPLLVNEWTHIAVTFAGTTATIYKNVTTTSSGYFTLGTNTNATFRIGSCAVNIGTVGTPAFFFNGAIDDVQVFNYARDVFGIASLYNNGLSQNFCLNTYSSTYDYNGNCKVDLPDLITFVSQWLSCGLYPDCP